MSDDIHNFDGITEREDTRKKLPTGLIIAAVVMLIWAIYFMLNYFPPFSGWSSIKEYQAVSAMKTPDPDKKETAAVNPYKDDKQKAEEGEKIFKQNCTSCHGEKLEGGVGPALVKKEWIYGGDDKNLFESVAKGRKGGMPAFENLLPAKKIWEIITYIQSRNK